MKKLLLLPFALLVGLLVTAPALAQDFEVPANYQFATADDYRKAERDVVQAVNWLEKTPLNQQQEKRQLVSKFVLDYASGSPTVSVEITPLVEDLTGKNPEMLLQFICGYTRHKLLNPTDNDKQALTMSGVKSVLKLYRIGGAKKDKKLDKLLVLEQKDKLRDWVSDKMR